MNSANLVVQVIFTVVVIDFYTLTHTCVQATMSPLQLYLYRYPHNFCKYEMLPIPCCIIIPLMCGLSCGLQRLYMHKHGSGNRLEQERKQHTSCHPITRAHHRRKRSRADFRARGNVKRQHTCPPAMYIGLSCSYMYCCNISLFE